MTSTTTTMLVVCLLALTVGINVLTVADCTMLEGLVAPIEVIEEWGCYDTEIRLTCGNLESRVAILEAKFTPRCDEDRPEECVHVDENSVTYSFASQRVDKLTLEEKEAGQRFLQTLRRSHEHEKSPDETVPSIGAVHAANDNDSLRLHGSPAPVSARTVKDKRSSLRATLEHLIVRYLRRITSSGEDEEDDESGGYEASSVRYRRQVAIGYVNGTELAASGGGDNSTEVVGNEGPDSSVEITLLTNDSDSSGNGSAMMGDSIEITVPPAAEVGGMLGDGSAVENVNGGLPFGSSVSTSEEKSSKIVADSGERPVMKVSRKHKAAKKKECSSIRKRIAQLDRFELEKSMRNDSFREYNIRSALNYRCSGKNHCSFVFSQDHPFAVVWKEGTVRVKYICMDDFRISQYCDEHLIIGNEDQWERRRSNEERDVSGDATTEDNESRHHPSAGGAATTAGRNYYSDNTNDPVGFAEDRRQRNQWSYDGDDGDDDSEYDGDDYDDASKGEPRAEALQQQPVVHQMHSFHNLKILKTFPSEEAPVNETEHQRKLEAEAAYRKRQKVFSQAAIAAPQPGLISAITGLAGAVVNGTIGLIGTVITGTTTLIGNVLTATVSGVQSLVSNTINSIGAVITNVNTGVVNATGTALNNAFTALLNAHIALNNVATAVVGNISANVGTALNNTVTGLQTLISNLNSAIASAIGAGTTGTSTFVNILNNLTTAIQTAVHNVTGTLTSVLPNVTSTIRTQLNSTIGTITGLLSNLTPGIGTIARTVLSQAEIALSNAESILGNLTSSVLGNLTTVAQSAVQTAVTNLQTLSSKLNSTLIDAIISGNPVGSTFNSILSNLTSAINATVQGIAGTLSSSVPTLINNVQSQLSSGLSTLTNLAATAGTTAATTLTNVASAVMNANLALAGVAGNALGNLAGILAGNVQNAVTDLQSIASTLNATLAAAIADGTTLTTGALSTLQTLASNLNSTVQVVVSAVATALNTTTTTTTTTTASPTTTTTFCGIICQLLKALG